MITLSISLILKLMIVCLSIYLLWIMNVLKESLSLDDGQAVGLDGLLPKLLHIAAPVIARPLTWIFDYIRNISG